MGILDAPTSPNRYATRARHLQGMLSARPTTNPELAPSPPTVSDSATATLTSNIHTVGCQGFNEFTPLGVNTVLNATFGFIAGDTRGGSGDELHFGFTLHGDSVEIQLRASTGFAGQRHWIWVDGKPVTAVSVAPDTNSITAGGSLYLKLVFGAVGSYDVKIYTSGWQLFQLVIPVAQGISACAKKPWLVGIVGDSWGASNSATGYLPLDAFPRWTGMALGAEIVQQCIPGTGYIKPGSTSQPYGHSGRVTAMTTLAPDLLVITAGGNDFDQGSEAQISAAATALYATYAAALPHTPIIVGGVFPNNIANVTTQSVVDCANAVRTAAVASPNVLGYFDPFGIADTGVIPAAYATSQVVVAGDRRTYLGGYLECTEGHTTGATPSFRRWKQLSWLYGTGHAANLTGDGNRDSFLGSDQGHPNAIVGSRWFGERVAAEVIRILRASG